MAIQAQELMISAKKIGLHAFLSDVKKGGYPDFYSKKVLLALFSFPGLQVTNTGLLASSSGPRGGGGASSR